MAVMPVNKGFYVTSGFGPRWGTVHYGTDFGLDGGSGGHPIFAIKSGTVTASGPASGFGQWVNVDHPASNGGGLSVYGHIIPEVSVGQAVVEGQRIGRINPDSNTNGGVAPHLHLEFHRYVWSPPGGDRLDPMKTVLDGAGWPGSPINERRGHMSITKSPGRKGDPVWLPEVLRAFGVEVVEDKGWKLWGNGDFGTIWGVIVHHTGANNTSANYIRYNPGLSNALSSQIHLSRTGVVTLVGAGIAWHAGRGEYPGLPTNNANAVTIGIEAQGDGQTWPAEQMEAYYRTVAAILWYLDLPVSRCISHWEYSMKAQGKWDPGLNGKPMPMGPFRAEVQKRIDDFNRGAEVPASSQEGAGMLFKQITDFIKGYLGPQIDALQEVWRQLRGPNGNGWSQLGQNAKGQNLTLVDAIAAVRHDIAALDAKINGIKGGK